MSRLGQQSMLAGKLLGIGKPIDEDPKGQWFTFEKAVPKGGKSGGGGHADVWREALKAYLEALATMFSKRRQLLCRLQAHQELRLHRVPADDVADLRLLRRQREQRNRDRGWER